MDDGKGSSSMAESEQEQFVALAKQLTELSRLEVASHEALTKRVSELETALAASRKDLADVRVRNETLTKQLKASAAAAEAAGVVLKRPVPSPAPPAPAASVPESASPPCNGIDERPPPLEAAAPPSAEEA